MAQEKLIDIRSGKGLDSGLFPSALPSSGAVWKDARNAWFRELHVEHALGRERAVGIITRRSQAIAQAYVSGIERFYYEDGGIISFYQGGVSTLVDALDAAGSYDLETYGTWLLATDNVNNLKLWKATGGFISVAASEFARCRIVKKLAQHVLAYNTDVFPTGFHWSTASNPEIWTPAANNSAGNLPIRELDSDVIAVTDLGAAHAVYSQAHMMVVQYVGYPNWFGTPNQALRGIGAASRHAVVSLGRFNWGLCKSGIFLTDGNSFSYIDRPAVDSWLRDNVDWDRADEISGYFDDQLLLVVWSVPTLDGLYREIAVDPKNRTSLIDNGKRTFTYLSDGFTAAQGRVVFDTPLVALIDGIYFASVPGTVIGDFYLASQLFDGGAQNFFKSWDYVMLEGEFGADAQVRFGFTDSPDFASVTWTAWQTATYKVPLNLRESVFIAVEFQATTTFKLTGMTIYGEKAGLVT